MRQYEHQKVTAEHLKRKAFLYIRQSSLRQVIENTESTRRQYDLRARALALGWSAEQIVVVDSDQGQSAATADRTGFQGMVAEVGLGHAGLVMGLEVSRLARNSADWHRLLEICALSGTLILDEDGLYDPTQFNDRLVLGLKGTMSEAELHLLRRRLQGGILAQAMRGELKLPLPPGLTYDEQSKVVLDPDSQIRQVVRLFFDTFRRIGTALGTVRAFQEQSLLFPRRPVRGPCSGIIWKPLDLACALRVLQNPRYAGIFAYGQRQHRRTADGRVLTKRKPPEEWIAFIPNAHEGYLSQQEYEENLRRLRENAQAVGADRRSPPREGPALLQGLVMCGKCGIPMRVHYHRRQGRMIPSYVCDRKIGPTCQSLHGVGIDQAIGELLVELMTPATLEISLAVQQEIQQQIAQIEQLRHKQVERNRYEADLARQRFLQVDPNNRLVASTLEADWNEKLKQLQAAQEDFERYREEDLKRLSEEQKSKIMELVKDFPRLWNDPQIPVRERKRMVRLLIEDVTLERGESFSVQVRFKGGATKTLSLPVPKSSWELRKTSPELLAKIDRLLDHHTEREIAELFNEKRITSPTGKRFKTGMVSRIRRTYGLKSRRQRLREAGCLTLSELAAELDVDPQTLNRWRGDGLLKVHYYDGRKPLYEVPSHVPTSPKRDSEPLVKAASKGGNPSHDV